MQREKKINLLVNDKSMLISSSFSILKDTRTWLAEKLLYVATHMGKQSIYVFGTSKYNNIYTCFKIK